MNIEFKSGARFEISCSLSRLGFMWHYHYAKPVQVVMNGNWNVTKYGTGMSIHLHKPATRHALPHTQFGDKYHWSSRVQNWLQGIGISMCNPLRSECTQDFRCCTWSVGKDTKEFLDNLSASMSTPGNKGTDVLPATTTDGAKVHVIVHGEGPCVFCGKVEDLRMGTCFDCGQHVETETLADGLVSLKHTVTNKIVVF